MTEKPVPNTLSPEDLADPLVDVSQLERELGLPKHFFVNLFMDEGDWSFVIKLHALVEATVAHLLAEMCGAELLPVFTRLPLSSETTGKLAFAKALVALGNDERLFVRKLSEIRNSFAHDVRQAGTTLESYVGGLSPEQLLSLKAAIGPGQDPFPIVEPPVPELEFVRDNPKLCIWLRALLMISSAYQRKDIAVLQRETAAIKARLLASLLERERRRLEREEEGEVAKEAVP